MKLAILFSLTACVLCTAQEKLRIISPHWEGVRMEVTGAFRDWYRSRYGADIMLEWLDQGGTSDDVRYVESMFRKNPGGIGIDLFFGGGVDPYLKLKEKGLLESYRVPADILKNIPAACAGIPNYDADFRWYGVVLSGFGILYNAKVLSCLNLPLPRDWDDLGRPEYYGWVGAADPRHSGSMHMMYEIILQAYGWERGWRSIFALAGNTRRFVSSASQVAQDTSLGEVALSISIDSYALAQIEVNGEENMGFVLPQGVTVINPDAIGILKGAANGENARRFIDFLLSYEGQLLWILPKGTPGGPREFSLNRLSIRPDVYEDPRCVAKTVNPYRFSSSFAYDGALASRRWALLNDLIGSCVIDCHGDLRKAWNRSARNRRTLMTSFAELPLLESEQGFFIRYWDNAVLRNQYVGRWLSFSRAKFRRMARCGAVPG